MVDTGARYSTLTVLPPGASLSADTVNLTGFESLQLTNTLRLSFASQTLQHQFIYAPQCPVNLLGRDLLILLSPMIKCSPDGLHLVFPNGHTYVCAASDAHAQLPVWTSSPADVEPRQPSADIYWAEIDITSPGWVDAHSVFVDWLPWFRHLQPYGAPIDCMHCTLYYDRNDDLCYRQKFEEIENTNWDIALGTIFAGPPGVAFQSHLTEDQLQWYMMSDPPDPTMPPCFPHVSLLISPSHTAKDLGPFVRACSAATDWQSTQTPVLQYSPSLQSYKIRTDMFNSASSLQHLVIDRHHGREAMDSDGAASLISSLPSALWSVGPTDVGLCPVSPVSFSYDSAPIFQYQYRTEPEGAAGVTETISGLLAAGVLVEIDHSDWNTPILPVRKKDSGKYRMVHDLRAINKIISTQSLPVPNPYAALSQLTPDHKFFSCIDLANAFFCLPLSAHLRPLFAFTWQGKRYTYTRLPQGFILSPGIFNSVLRQLLSKFEPPEGVLLVQYVDDLLLAAPSEAVCLSATHSLLLHLYSVGLKCSQAKLQIARAQVSFLGRLVSQNGTGVSSSHKHDILHHPKPTNVKEMLSFLGLANYSRMHVPDYAELSLPLRSLVNSQGMRNLSARLDWTTESEQAFIALKQLVICCWSGYSRLFSPFLFRCF